MQTNLASSYLCKQICLVLINGNKKKDGCTICGEKATQTFQDSEYCEKHYTEAVLWAFDNVAQKDD